MDAQHDRQGIRLAAAQGFAVPTGCGFFEFFLRQERVHLGQKLFATGDFALLGLTVCIGEAELRQDIYPCASEGRIVAFLGYFSEVP